MKLIYLKEGEIQGNNKFKVNFILGGFVKLGPGATFGCFKVCKLNSFREEGRKENNYLVCVVLMDSSL